MLRITFGFGTPFKLTEAYPFCQVTSFLDDSELSSFVYYIPEFQDLQVTWTLLNMINKRSINTNGSFAQGGYLSMSFVRVSACVDWSCPVTSLIFLVVLLKLFLGEVIHWRSNTHFITRDYVRLHYTRNLVLQDRSSSCYRVKCKVMW